MLGVSLNCLDLSIEVNPSRLSSASGHLDVEQLESGRGAAVRTSLLADHFLNLLNHLLIGVSLMAFNLIQINTNLLLDGFPLLLLLGGLGVSSGSVHLGLLRHALLQVQGGREVDYFHFGLGLDGGLFLHFFGELLFAILLLFFLVLLVLLLFLLLFLVFVSVDVFLFLLLFVLLLLLVLLLLFLVLLNINDEVFFRLGCVFLFFIRHVYSI
mmetsp:Transcript_5061/g.7638  ORF Transcript_5061/g.7638 Transcript_5061/m.7638 type:complete len:212 (-) Transcript_5061:2-637(-)